MSISMPNLLSLKFFIPELILSGTVLLLLVAALFSNLEKHAGKIAIAGLLAAMCFSFPQSLFGNPPLFWGLIILDKPAVFFKIIFAIAGIIVSIFSMRSNELTNVAQDFSPAKSADLKVCPTNDCAEYFALLVGSVLGMNLLAQSANILMIYLSLEFVSLSSYLLVAYAKNSARSSEAALKYVLFGAVASGVFLFGASLYYGATGSLSIGVADFSLRQLSQAKACYSLSGFFMLAGFLYKIAAVPMQAWCPDAYEGAPTPVTAFLSVAPKAAGFAILMRVSQTLGLSLEWPILIAIISAITMTIGNLAAIPQTNVKRLLAYSSIAHAGYLLMAVACNTARGNEAIYFYFVAYLIMNLGAFLIVQIVSNPPQPPFSKGGSFLSPPFLKPVRQYFGGGGEGGLESLDAFKGLSRRGPIGVFLSIAMTIFLLSLTGVPPFVGFIGKFYLFSAVIESKIYWLAIVGIINSVISLYYYARIIKAMFFDVASDENLISMSARSLTACVVTLSLATVFFGLIWQWLANTVSQLI